MVRPTQINLVPIVFEEEHGGREVVVEEEVGDETRVHLYLLRHPKHAATWTRHPSFSPLAPHTTSMSTEMKPPLYNISKHYHSDYVSTAKIESHVLTSCAMVAIVLKGHV